MGGLSVSFYWYYNDDGWEDWEAFIGRISTAKTSYSRGFGLKPIFLAA